MAAKDGQLSADWKTLVIIRGEDAELYVGYIS